MENQLAPEERTDYAGHNHGTEAELEAHAEWDEATAKWYTDNYGEWPSNRITIHALALQADDNLLDIGCGSGSALREASELITKGRLVGADPTPGMVEIATQNTQDHPAQQRIEYIRSGAGDLDLEDASIQIAISINALHHWDDIAAGLQEVLRVLVPGGQLVVCEDHEVQEMSGVNKDQILKVLKQAGFVVEKTEVHHEGDVSLDLMFVKKAIGLI